MTVIISQINLLVFWTYKMQGIGYFVSCHILVKFCDTSHSFTDITWRSWSDIQLIWSVLASAEEAELCPLEGPILKRNFKIFLLTPALLYIYFSEKRKRLTEQFKSLFIIGLTFRNYCFFGVKMLNRHGVRINGT